MHYSQMPGHPYNAQTYASIIYKCLLRGVLVVWEPAPSQGEEGSGTTGIRALFQCPECGRDQPHCSVVLSISLNACASQTRQLYAMFHTAVL